MLNALMDERRTAHDLTDADQGTGVSVLTRFGEIEFDREKALRTHHGLPGFPDLRLMGLAALPQGRFESLRLLQGLEPGDPGFLVMPAPVINPWMERRDILQALDFLRLPPEEAALLLMVSARRGDRGPELSMNLRAPLVVDTSHRRARQVVLANSRYPVRQPI